MHQHKKLPQDDDNDERDNMVNGIDSDEDEIELHSMKVKTFDEVERMQYIRCDKKSICIFILSFIIVLLFGIVLGERVALYSNKYLPRSPGQTKGIDTNQKNNNNDNNNNDGGFPLGTQEDTPKPTLDFTNMIQNAKDTISLIENYYGDKWVPIRYVWFSFFLSFLFFLS